VGRALLGEDELQVLEFLAEHRVATTRHVQELLGGSRQAAGVRMGRLERARLAHRQEIFVGQPATCWITRRGLDAIESRLPAPEPNLKEYRHDVGAAWLWLAARRGVFGELRGVVSERTMRSTDRREGAPGHRYGVGAGAGGRLHYPDLLLQTPSGHRVAVELELTGKGRRRLDGIMLGYAADPRIDGVLYLCPRGRVGAGVREAARQAGIGERVSVQVLAPGSPEGARPERATGRAGPQLASGRLTQRAPGRAIERTPGRLTQRTPGRAIERAAEL
jgi:hypothetical protein